MMYKLQAVLKNNVIELDLDDTLAPKTVRAIIDILPISVNVHTWGEELYTDPIPVDVGVENSKPVVAKMDVAYWPPGHAICLFFGPTPIGENGAIVPYSPVNVIGKMAKNTIFPTGNDVSKVIIRLS